MTDRSTHDVDVAALENALEWRAAEAIHRLHIGEEIDQLRPTLFQQIEKCDDVAGSSDALFIASSLPMANALIHYGASQRDLENASNWARLEWPEAHDPTSTLAVLTLIYLVEQGLREFGDDPQRRAKWERIHGRIQSVLEAELEAVA